MSVWKHRVLMGVEYECQETLYIEKNNPPVFVRWWLVSQSMAESGKRKLSASSEESDAKRQRAEAEAGAVAAAAPPREHVYLHHVTIMRHGADCNSMPLGGDEKGEQASDRRPSGAEPPKSLPKEMRAKVQQGADLQDYEIHALLQAPFQRTPQKFFQEFFVEPAGGPGGPKNNSWKNFWGVL